MGVQVTLRNILGQFLSASGFNANNADLEGALDKALDRTDIVDNSMEVNLDMGLHKIINLQDPSNPTDAVNKKYTDTMALNADASAEAAAKSAVESAKSAADSAESALESATSASEAEVSAEESLQSSLSSAISATASERSAEAASTHSNNACRSAQESASHAVDSKISALNSQAYSISSEVSANKATESQELAYNAAASSLDNHRFIPNTDFSTIGGVNNDLGPLSLVGVDFINENLADPRTSLSTSTGSFDNGTL